jgi:hypothetical protein
MPGVDVNEGASGRARATAGHIWAITDAQVDQMYVFGTDTSQLRARLDMPVAQASPGHPLTGVLTRCALMPGVTSRPPMHAQAPTPTLPQRGEGALFHWH